MLSAVQNMYGPAFGERLHQAKMTAVGVLEVYRMRKAGYTQQKIAEAFGVQRSTIYSILTGKTWPHLYHHFTDN